MGVVGYLSRRKILIPCLLLCRLTVPPAGLAESLPPDGRLVPVMEDAQLKARSLPGNRPVRSVPPLPGSAEAGRSIPDWAEPEAALALPVRRARSPEPLFSMEIPDQPAVQRRVEWYLSREKGALQSALRRASVFRAFISRRLQEYGLPLELLFLPVLESSYSARALSRSGAAGLWQIMRNTSTALGLASDEWLDERRDFWKSTEAALRKLRENYALFGDWSLALAAYNCGTGRLLSILRSSGITDFWELRRKGLLPRETAEYVPSFFALAVICSYPQSYGLDGGWEEGLRWERVSLARSVDLRLLADELDLSWETLREANSELKYFITPPGGRGYFLKIPASKRERVEQLLADPQALLLKYRYHRIRTGDTFYSLARSYGVALALIERSNQGMDPRRLAIGSIVRIPAVGGVTAPRRSFWPRPTAGPLTAPSNPERL